MFNLEKSVAAWRRQMARGGIKSQDVLDELENHLREDMEQQMRAGATAEQAFARAEQRVGCADELKLEFGKVERLRPVVSPTLINLGCAGIGVFVAGTGMWLLLNSAATIAEQVLGSTWLILVAAFIISLPYLNRSVWPGVPGWVLRKIIAVICNLAVMGWVALLLLDCENIIHLSLGTMVLPNLICWPLIAAAVAAILVLTCGTEAKSLGFWSPAAQQSLVLAHEAAQDFDHDFVGTEHILLGLLESEDGAVSKMLGKMAVRPEMVRAEIEKIVASGPQSPTGRAPTYTPRAMKAFSLAMKEAKASHCIRVETPHLLLGLLREGSGVAGIVLKKLGVNLERARAEVLNTPCD